MNHNITMLVVGILLLILNLTLAIANPGAGFISLTFSVVGSVASIFIIYKAAEKIWNR